VTEPKELRLALVLNGGVSLAVWISGVVHEIDRLRRAKQGQTDTAGYDDALGEDRTARVDVIAAAIQGGGEDGPKPLLADGAPIRDVWLDIGDLAKLARPANAVDPRSLLKGDEYFLPTLEHVLDDLLVPAADSALGYPLYLYLTATALRATRDATFATSADTIYEPDHRVVFRFSAQGLEKDAAPSDPSEMGTTLPLDAREVTRLARAARSTSSFPAAFPPHEALLRRPGDETPTKTYLADGGILDNQPFDPVLDRVSLMPVTETWRRVLLYVVPYVTERAKAADANAAAPGIAEVVAASGLSRDLPKLTSLERVEAARAEGVTAARVTDVLHEAESEHIASAAEALLPTYREVQAREIAQTIEQWVASPPSVGTGTLGSDETLASTQARMPLDAGYGADALAELLPSPDWDEAKRAWRGASWCWGLSKAERFARGALRDLAPHEGEPYEIARERAMVVVRVVRVAMQELRGAFYKAWDDGTVDPLAAFKRAYRSIDGPLAEVDEALDALLVTAPLPGLDAGAWRERLAATEVVANVAGTRPPPAPSFDFYRVSADGCVLGHEARTPEAKLAGMQLGHFAAFMKRSWRANDWMWGRLDGVAWLGVVLGKDETWVDEQQIAILREELVQVGKAVAVDEREHYSPSATSIEATSAPVRTTAPCARAARASARLIAPMPPRTCPHAPPAPSSEPSSWWSRLYAVPGVYGPAPRRRHRSRRGSPSARRARTTRRAGPRPRASSGGRARAGARARGPPRARPTRRATAGRPARASRPPAAP
jgi:hypothetical protein